MNADESINEQELRSQLMKAIDELNEQERTVLSLYYYEDLTMREIGQVLGISEAAVKTRLSRGRGRLRLLLEEK